LDKYFDYLISKKSGAFDGALAYYFIGRKSEVVLQDKDLLDVYKGITPSLIK